MKTPTHIPKKTTALFVCMLLLFGWLTGCRSWPLCPEKPNSPRTQLKPLWNTIVRQQNPGMLKHWLDQFLTVLLSDQYQLEEHPDRYELVRTYQSNDSLCKVNISGVANDLSAPHFLYTLHKIVKKYNVALRENFLYSKNNISTTIIRANTQTNGGDCTNRRFLVDFSYWKAISGKYDPKTWNEACQLSKKLHRWQPCFTPKMKLLFQQRRNSICK